MAATNKVSLKLLIDKQSNKVMFAEAGNDFVDFLFSLLSLPISTVINLLKTSAMVGCIGNLYESLENLNDAYIQPNRVKNSLLKPTANQMAHKLPLLLPDIDNPQPSAGLKIYACSSSKHRCIVSDRSGVACSYCDNIMTSQLKVIREGTNSSSGNTTTASDCNEGGCVKGLVTYMVTDDLSVSPLSMISGVSLLNKYSAKGFGSLEEKTVEFGADEGLELLKASLQTRAALTTVFLAKHEEIDAAPPTEELQVNIGSLPQLYLCREAERP